MPCIKPEWLEGNLSDLVRTLYEERLLGDPLKEKISIRATFNQVADEHKQGQFAGNKRSRGDSVSDGGDNDSKPDYSSLCSRLIY